MKDIIDGLKTIGSIIYLVGEGLIIKSEEVLRNSLKAMGEYEYKEEEKTLEEKWINELNYYSDERINSELKNYNIPYNTKYDGRYTCIKRLAKYNSDHNYKVI